MMRAFSVTPRLPAHKIISVTTGIAGLLVLLGWLARIPVLVSVIPGQVAMNPTTALIFVLAAVSLWLVSNESQSGGRRRLGDCCAFMVIAAGLLRLIAYFGLFDTGIDQILFRERLQTNRMAPNTALYFILLGSALLSMRTSGIRLVRNLDQSMAAVLAAGALLAIIGYSLGAQSLYGVSSFIPMALNTAILFEVMSIGIILARPNRGLMPLIRDQGPAGMLIRSLVPLALVVHPVLASLRLRGERLGYYNTEFGVSLMVVASITIFAAGILWTGRLLERADRARRTAQRQLQHAHDELAQRVEERTDHIKQLYEQMKLQVEQLASTNRALSEKNQENEMFVYSVSHDLRSPLVNLQGFSQELTMSVECLRSELRGRQDVAAAMDMLDRDFAPAIHFIQTAVRRLSNLIDALLRLSRAGRVEYHCTLVNIDGVIQRITDAMNATITAKGAALQCDHLPPAWGDPAALEQLFANLIGNALQYLEPKRAGMIQIGSEAASSSERARYFIRDNGLGIAPEYQKKVFDAFKRVHPDVCPGEGMGLAIVRRIVERHDGQLWVESEPGKGSTFFVELPVVSSRSNSVHEACAC